MISLRSLGCTASRVEPSKISLTVPEGRLGLASGEGLGEGLTSGEGLGEGLGLASGEGLGEGLGEGEGLASGEGVGEEVASGEELAATSALQGLTSIAPSGLKVTR
jgi:hypothetical protein